MVEDAVDTSRPKPAPAPDPSRIGRYVILGRLGAGGMGVVYSAYDGSLDRKVALKLLHHRTVNASASRVRLKREAQALAQLSHPNVVQVYDVGEWHGQDYIALEFIRGQTLREWLAERPRPWTDVVDVFVQAGRGLAAAHAAGLIHRDFKPDNVLIAADGRARVADFGLALLDPAERDTTGDPESSQSGRSTVRVTQAGALLGTPAYMAPEQFLRHETDVRVDQFAFCVTFFESLFGYRPFAGESLDEISRHVVMGDLLAPPPRSPVPTWLADLLARGLALAPADRFPSMDALLAELTRDRARGRRWLAGLSALAAVIAAIVALQWQAGATCQGAAARLAGVWDDARRADVDRALQATGLAYAADTWQRVRGELDTYAAAWTDMHTSACEAHQRGEQSSLALDLRMSCLEHHRADLAALVDVLADADTQTVNNAAQAVRALPALAECNDIPALLDEQRRLGRPADAETAAKVEALRNKLAQVEALANAGQVVRSVALGADLPDQARSLGYLPTIAEAEFLRARTLQDSGALRDAADMLRRAYLSALRANHELVAARALVSDVFVQASDLRDFAEADRSYETANALLSRIAPDGPLAAELLNNLGVARLRAHRLRDAEPLLRAALELRRKVQPPDPGAVAASLNNLGLDLVAMERFDDAEERYRDAVALMQSSVGPRHPWTAIFECNLALPLFDTGKLAEAKRALADCLGPLVETVGRDRADSAEYFAVHGLLHLDEDPAGGLAELRHAHELGERSAVPEIRCLTRFALAQSLWREPAERPRAIELAHAAAADAAAAGRSVRLGQIDSWLETHVLEDMYSERLGPAPPPAP